MIHEDTLKYITEATKRFAKEASVVLPADVRAYAQEVLNNPLVFNCTLVGKGYIIGMAAPSFLNPERKQAQELAWYVEPEYRGTPVAIKLLRMYERKALDLGCQEVTMVALEALDPLKVEAIYKRAGYRKFETHYTKEVENGSNEHNCPSHFSSSVGLFGL